MRRETSNIIRAVLEDWIPPAIRDLGLFRYLFRLVHDGSIDAMADLRRRAAYLSDAEIEAFYRSEHAQRLHEGSDNSEAILARIREYCVSGSICDVGCGTGHTLRYLADCAELKDSSFVGIDFDVPEKTQDNDGRKIAFRRGNALSTGFDDKAFDTVICTHVLEHILDFRAALSELRRITRKRLIIVVPREREYIYNFNPHFHFFPYRHALLRYLIPLPQSHGCDDVGRDLFYWENAL